MKEEDYQEDFKSLKQYKDKKEYIHQLVNFIKEALYDKNRFVRSSNESILTDLYGFLETKIEEIYNLYKKSNPDNKEIANDIEFIGYGHTSLTFRIGDLALKISKSNSSINPHAYSHISNIIPVFFYKDFEITSKEHYIIQITPLVDTHNISEEEVYGAYKELRDYGYIWNDPLKDNVGKIIKDINYNNRTYKTGDVVIIDLEDFAFVGEITPDVVLEEISMTAYNRNTYIYETRYMEEKAKLKK